MLSVASIPECALRTVRNMMTYLARGFKHSPQDMQDHNSKYVLQEQKANTKKKKKILFGIG